MTELHGGFKLYAYFLKPEISGNSKKTGNRVKSQEKKTVRAVWLIGVSSKAGWQHQH